MATFLMRADLVVRGELRLEPLVAVAIERGVRARHQVIERAE